MASASVFTIKRNVPSILNSQVIIMKLMKSELFSGPLTKLLLKKKSFDLIGCV